MNGLYQRVNICDMTYDAAGDKSLIYHRALPTSFLSLSLILSQVVADERCSAASSPLILLLLSALSSSREAAAAAEALVYSSSSVPIFINTSRARQYLTRRRYKDAFARARARERMSMSFFPQKFAAAALASIWPRINICVASPLLSLSLSFFPVFQA